MRTDEHDRRIQAVADDLDMAKHLMNSFPVGSIDWRMMRQRVLVLDEKLHQSRIERMTGP